MWHRALCCTTGAMATSSSSMCGIPRTRPSWRPLRHKPQSPRSQMPRNRPRPSGSQPSRIWRSRKLRSQTPKSRLRSSQTQQRRRQRNKLAQRMLWLERPPQRGRRQRSNSPIDHCGCGDRHSEAGYNEPSPRIDHGGCSARHSAAGKCHRVRSGPARCRAKPAGRWSAASRSTACSTTVQYGTGRIISGGSLHSEAATRGGVRHRPGWHFGHTGGSPAWAGRVPAR